MIEGLALTEQSLVRLACSLLPWPFPLGFCRLTTRYVILLSQFSLIILLSRLAAELSALREAILSTKLVVIQYVISLCQFSLIYCYLIHRHNSAQSYVRLGRPFIHSTQLLSAHSVNSQRLKWIYCFIQRYASAQSYVRCGRSFYPLDSGNPVLECSHVVIFFVISTFVD